MGCFNGCYCRSAETSSTSSYWPHSAQKSMLFKGPEFMPFPVRICIMIITRGLNGLFPEYINIHKYTRIHQMYIMCLNLHCVRLCFLLRNEYTQLNASLFLASAEMKRVQREQNKQCTKEKNFPLKRA